MKYYILVISLLISLSSFADKEGEAERNKESGNEASCMIEGFITDREDGEALTGVTVRLENGEEAYTDFDGNFKFENIEAGNHNIKVSYISYKDVIYKNINIDSESTKTLNIKLRSIEN